MAYPLIDIRKTIPRHPTRKWSYRDHVDTIVVHCTAGNQQDPNQVARHHIQPGPQNRLSSKGAPGLAYHDFIDNQGRVFHCNNYNDSTWHARSYNARSIGVVIAYPGASQPPAAKQLKSLIHHIAILCLYIKLEPKQIKGHRELPGMSTIFGHGSIRYKKVCPGLLVDMDHIRDAVCRRLQQRLYDEGLYLGKIDGQFGPMSRQALYNFQPIAKSYLRLLGGGHR